jgi:hypothetical protein
MGWLADVLVLVGVMLRWSLVSGVLLVGEVVGNLAVVLLGDWCSVCRCAGSLGARSRWSPWC